MSVAMELMRVWVPVSAIGGCLCATVCGEPELRLDAPTDTRDGSPSVAPGLPKIAAVWSDPLRLDRRLV
jgi:hypothetical protein